MFKRRSANHPTTPKIPSVALPETFSPPINISYTLDYTGRGRDRNSSSANRSSSSFFNRFRSSPALSTGSTDSRSQSRTGYDSPSHAGYGAGYQNQPTRGSRPRGASDATTESESTSDEDEGEPDGDGVIYKQILPNVVAIREFKNLTKEERMELKMEERKVIELARKHPNARITLVKSKARIEEEQEREEEELKRRQRERERDNRRAREQEYNELQARAKQKSAEDDDPFARQAARVARKAAEEEERRRQKEYREMEDSKKKAQEMFKADQAMRQAILERTQREEQQQKRARRQSSSQPHQPQPTSRPIKGILKPANGPTTPAPPMTFGGGPSPEPEEEQDNGYASSHQPLTQAQNFARRNSVQAQPSYHSDTEQYRSSLSRGQRSHTFSYGAPQPASHPQRANTYPIDPRSSPWTQPPSAYAQPQHHRDSSRSRSGSDSHSRSRSGSHSQIEPDVHTDSELAHASYNAMLNRNNSRHNASSRTRNASFSGPPPGMCPPVPPMTGYGPMPPVPGPTMPHQPQPHSSRYMKPYRKADSPPQQARWWFPPDSYTPGHVHTADSPKWEPPILPWTLSDHTTRVVDAKHPPQPVVFFDLAFDPRMREYEVKCMRPGESRLSSLTRDEETKLAAAGMMAMPTMIIVNDMYPNWTVVVYAMKGNTCRVCEVFRAIHDTYAMPLTQQELSMIPQSQMRGVMAAFEQRCKDGPGLPPVEMAKGPKRVDLLRSERFFRGLEYVAALVLFPPSFECVRFHPIWYSKHAFSPLIICLLYASHYDPVTTPSRLKGRRLYDPPLL